jgi:hypothetical protein
LSAGRVREPGTTAGAAAEEVEQTTDPPFEDALLRARPVLGHGEPLVHGRVLLDTAGLP